MRSDPHVDRAAVVDEARAVPLVLRIEMNLSACLQLRSGRDLGRLHDVLPGAQVECVELGVERQVRRFRCCHHIDRGRVRAVAHNDGCAGNAVFGLDVAAPDVVRRLRLAETHLPENGVGLGVIGVDRIMAGRDDEDIVRRAVRHLEVGHDERLREHIPVDLERGQLTEAVRPHRRGSQVGFALVPARGIGVVMVVQRVDRSAGIDPFQAGCGIRMQALFGKGRRPGVEREMGLFLLRYAIDSLAVGRERGVKGRCPGREMQRKPRRKDCGGGQHMTRHSITPLGARYSWLSMSLDTRLNFPATTIFACRCGKHRPLLKR